MKGVHGARGGAAAALMIMLSRGCRLLTLLPVPARRAAHLCARAALVEGRKGGG
jgi:hypothetical protein